MNSNKCLLSVVIPIRNEEKFIIQTLMQLHSQTLDKEKFEVIVVDGESSDSTKALVQEFIQNHKDMNISLSNNPKRLSSAARNIGFRAAIGRYVLIIDGHVYLPSENTLTNYLNSAMENSAAVLGRPQPLDPPGTSQFQQSVALARTSKLAHSQESFIYSDFSGFVSPLSVAVMYDKSVSKVVGEFDETFDAAEDLEFNYRLEKANYECFISNDLAVKYYPRSNIISLFKQLTRYGIGRARFINKHPERFKIENIAPAVLFLLAALTPIMLILNSVSATLWSVGGLSYCLILMAEAIRLVRSEPEKDVNIFYVAASIATVHFGLGWGFLKGTYQNLFTQYFLKKPS